MGYRKHRKSPPRERDPLTGVALDLQVEVIDDAYQTVDGRFNADAWNRANAETADVFCIRSAAWLSGYSPRYYVAKVLPDQRFVHRLGQGSFIATCTTSLQANAKSLHARASAARSAGGKQQTGNLIRWQAGNGHAPPVDPSDPSSGRAL